MRRLPFYLLPFLQSFLIVTQTLGQDIQQAQFFAMPVLTNPAFSGNMEFDCKELKSNIRGSWLSRRQWGAAFSTDAMLLEMFHKKSRMGFASLYQNQRVSGNRFSMNSFGLCMSHRLNIGDQWHLASGVQLQIVQRSFGFSQLKYTDQFSDNGFSGIPGPDNLRDKSSSKIYPDIGAGVLAFNQTFWAGVSVQHLNRPLISEFNPDEKLAMKFSVQAGAKIPFRSDPNFGLFRRDVSLHPVTQFRVQWPFSQLDAGFYYNHEPFMAGLLYRGFAVFKEDADGKISQDAAVILVGIKYEGLRIGYSIELNLKKKTTGAFPTQELNLSYQYARKGCLRRRFGKWVPVPSI